MSTSKGSKIAMAAAGLILITGTATAIAMTQKDSTDTLPLIGTEEAAPANSDNVQLPDPAAETSETAPLSPDAVETMPKTGEEAVPGMKNLDSSKSDAGSESIIKEPAQQTE